MAQLDPGGVSWTTRIVSVTWVSWTFPNPTCS
jgi:hypothetical protein